MLNKLSDFIRQYDMIRPGERVIVALSGGADSVALLLGLYLLKEKLDITLEAAHFNHRLRGEESDADQAFSVSLCDHYDVPLHLGSGDVNPGKKGLEAAARDARYTFLKSLNAKIATAHTADDNAETVLMHLVRGTGLKGLGGIAPAANNLIRPMLSITRQEVEEFLAEYCQNYRTDSSNLTDQFLRNRLRHRVMPILKEENPRLSQSISAMALRLRQDEEFLTGAAGESLPDIPTLRGLHPAIRARALERFLRESGVKEPEQSHLALAEKLVFSPKPSASARFPGGVTIARSYDRLCRREEAGELKPQILEGELLIPQLGLKVTVEEAAEILNTADVFTIHADGPITLRARKEGDALKLSGGTKSLKKRFIDKKIPAAQRAWIPVLEDSGGILGVYGFGADLSRRADTLPALTIRFTKTDNNGG